MKVTCKCHGLSGSCSLITCWQQLAPFRKVGKMRTLDICFEPEREEIQGKTEKDILISQNIFISGDHLREKYSGATRVKPTRQGRLRLHRRKARIPTANDLVFIKESPDYCHHNSTTGSLGEETFLSYHA